MNLADESAFALFSTAYLRYNQGMTRICTLAVIGAVLGLILNAPIAQWPQGSVAAQAHAQQIPLMIVRFNQKNVHFERQLYNAVARANQVKPDVRFDLVSFVPVLSSQGASQAAFSKASINQQKVAQSLAKMGVPRPRINLITQTQPGIQFDEVHIFVK